jgi:hypothetical protein
VMMEAVRTSEKSVYFYETTRRFVPEVYHLLMEFHLNLMGSMSHLEQIEPKLNSYDNLWTIVLNVIEMCSLVSEIKIEEGRTQVPHL